MKHKKCGGKMLKIQKSECKTVYQCNRCGKILSVYHKRIATRGNLAEGGQR